MLWCADCGKWSPVSDPQHCSWRCPQCGAFLRLLRCGRCGHEWSPRTFGRLPKICPKCKSPYWDREKCREYRGGGVL